MKRFFLTSLALLLVTASFGHVLAAVFCPRALGGECCFAKTRHHVPSSDEHKAASDMRMDEMSMDGMNMAGMDMDGMAMGDTSIDHNAVDDIAISAATVDKSIPSSRLAFGDQAVANKLDQPVEMCQHCLGHSGILNAPISSVSVPNRSNTEIGLVPLHVAGFLARPVMTLAQIGLPRDHAPPGGGAPRHILINVFLI
jgi:hypothetical protein